ncbi:hypothetical protein ACFSSE_04485 [Pedobacter alpinus]|uniref:Uncharacterized protein n=2 Tax=Pedobacter alpinus TaxID=1590643 RepID=A0ABW5TR42_9SPHI
MKNKYSTILLAIFSIGISLSFVPKSQKVSPLLMVGIAYKGKKCDNVTFSEGVGYKFINSCYGGDYTEIQDGIESTLNTWYGVDKSNMSFSSSSKSNGVIISYFKKVSGYACSLKKYAVGYGNNYSEALESAIKSKEITDRESSYRIETSFSCSN